MLTDLLNGSLKLVCYVQILTILSVYNFSKMYSKCYFIIQSQPEKRKSYRFILAASPPA